MVAERDVLRIVRSWLRTDEHESADRVLDNVLDLLDATPQRRSWWPAWRPSDMNTFAKLALAAAAVVVVAFVGIKVLPSSGGAGGGGPAVAATPSPTASPTLAPSPSPTPLGYAFPPAGELSIGRHALTGGGVPYSINVATSGWNSNGEWGIDRGSTSMAPDGVGFILWPEEAPVGVFADPCANRKAPPIGPSAADLAAAVAAVPGTDLVSGPSDVTVGGYPAKHVVLTIREDIGCVPAGFYLWYGLSAGMERYASQLGSTIRVWIIDVDGAIVWIDGETYKGAGPEPGQQIQQIVDSIQFE